jgi:hypothetical protein
MNGDHAMEKQEYMATMVNGDATLGGGDGHSDGGDHFSGDGYSDGGGDMLWLVERMAQWSMTEVAQWPVMEVSQSPVKVIVLWPVAMKMVPATMACHHGDHTGPRLGLLRQILFLIEPLVH